MQSPGAHVCRERMLKLGPHLLQLRSSPRTPRAGGRPDQQDLAVAFHAQQWTTNRETEMSAICMELAAVRFGRGAAHTEAVCSCHDVRGVFLRLDLLSGHCGLCLRSVYSLDILVTFSWSMQIRERAQARRPCKHFTPPKPRGVQKVKASPTRRLKLNSAQLQEARSAVTPPRPNSMLTPTLAKPKACTVRRVSPRAPVKRSSCALLSAAPVSSPPVVALRHIGAGADGLGHSPGAIAASELFVKQQQQRDAQERARRLDDNMRALGRAAGHRLSVSRQLQAMDTAMADEEAARCRTRLAALSEHRRGRLAGLENTPGASTCEDDNMSVRKAVARGSGLQDCTNRLWTPGQFINARKAQVSPSAKLDNEVNDAWVSPRF